MRTTALLLVAALVLGASPVRAEEAAVSSKQRGFLTGLGMGLLIGGLASVGAGVGGVLSANDASVRLAAYGGSPSAEELPTVTALEQRLSGGTTLAAVGFIVGGLALAGGVTCLLLDAPVAKASVAFVPTVQGGTFVFSARF